MPKTVMAATSFGFCIMELGTSVGLNTGRFLTGSSMANITKPSITGHHIGQSASVSFGSWDASVASLSGAIIKSGTVWQTGLSDGQSITWTAAEDQGQFILRVIATLSDGSTEQVYSAPVTVGYAPPVAIGALMDEILDYASGDYVIDAAADFTGSGLSYSVSGAGASINPSTGQLTIPTDTLYSAVLVTVTATNSGGSANSSFLVTVEDLDEDPNIVLLADDWALSGPRPDGFDIVVFDVPDDPANPVSDLQYSLDGAGWQSVGGAGAGLYSVNGLAEDQGYSVTLRAVAGSPGAPSDQKWVATIPGDPRGFRGWDPAVDLGGAGDIFVAPYGDDMSAGTLADPFRTVSHALTQATSGSRVKIRAGTYREAITLGAGVTVEGYGVEKPHITASEILTGLTRCDANDAGVLGASLGVAGSPVFKTVIDKAGLGYTNIRALNLFEAGRRIYPATDRPDLSYLFAEKDERTFHVADQFVLTSTHQVTDIVDTSVFNPARYSDAQLIGQSVLLYHHPNVVTTVSITDADVSQGRVSVSGLKFVQGKRANPNPGDLRFALTNIAQALVPGTYFIRDIGAAAEVYVYPRNPLHLDTLEYSPRVAVASWQGNASNITLRGLHLSRATGQAYGEGANIRKTATGALSSGNLIEHVLSTGTQNVGDISRSAHMRGTADSTIRRCSFFDIPGRGVWFLGLNTSNRGIRNMLSHSVFFQIGGAAYLNYSQDQVVFAHNLSDRTGLEAHGNKSNAYQQTDGVLWWGNEFGRDCNGYLTWQEASTPVVAFNLLPISSKYLRNERAVVDQQNNTAPPSPGSTGYIFNNTIPPQPGNNGSWGHLSVDLYQKASDIAYVVTNNVAHGLTGPAQMPVGSGPVKSNVITDLGWDGVKNTSAADYDATNVVETNRAQVYTDYANGDFSPASGSPILTTMGQDMQAEIALLQGLFPQFSDWGLDYKGQAIDWSALPVGADAGVGFIRG